MNAAKKASTQVHLQESAARIRPDRENMQTLIILNMKVMIFDSPEDLAADGMKQEVH